MKYNNIKYWKFICILFVGVFVFIVQNSHAEDYEDLVCDFDDSEERALWTLSPNNSGVCWRWTTYSSAISGSGKSNVLLLSDGVSSLSYTNSQSSKWAYRSFTIPEGENRTSTISFTYKCAGESGCDYMSAYLSTTVPSGSTPPPSGGTTLLSTGYTSSATWKTNTTSSVTLTAGTTYYISFYFKSDGSVIHTPGGIVSGVTITNIVEPPKPYQLKFTSIDYVTFTATSQKGGDPFNATLPSISFAESSYSTVFNIDGWYIIDIETGDTLPKVYAQGETLNVNAKYQAVPKISYKSGYPKTITFDVGAHGICETSSVTGFLPVTMPAVEAEDGWRFDGWTSGTDVPAPMTASQVYPSTGSLLTKSLTFKANYTEVFTVLGWKMSQSAASTSSYYSSSNPDTLIILYNKSLPFVQIQMIDTAEVAATAQTILPVVNTKTAGYATKVDTCIYKIPINAAQLYLGNYKGGRMRIIFLKKDKTESESGYLRLPHVYYPTEASAAGTRRTMSSVAVGSVGSDGYTYYSERQKLSDMVLDPCGTGLHLSLPASTTVTVRNLYIYGGARLDIPKGSTLRVRGNIYMRSGELEGSRLSPTVANQKLRYRYRYPQLTVNGNLEMINGGKVYYDMICDTAMFYPFCVPYDVDVKDVMYWNGDSAHLVLNYSLASYDGAYRATWREGVVQGDSTAWKKDSSSTVIYGGKGYIISAKSMLVKPASTGQSKQYQQYALLRFPMKVQDLPYGELSRTRSVAIAAHPSTRGVPIHSGWNLVGNPYLSSFGDVQHTNKYHSNGLAAYQNLAYESNGIVINNGGDAVDQLNYVVIPSDDGKSYKSYVASTYSLPAFKNFFIQVGTTSDSLAFPMKTQRINKPAYMSAEENDSYRFGLTLTTADSALTDEVGFLIGDDYTDDYEINADLAKWENDKVNLFACSGNNNLAFLAVGNERAETKIPLGLKLNARYNKMVIALDDNYDNSGFEHVYLYDDDEEVTTDLMQKSYTLSSTKCNNRSRLSLRVVRKEQTPTALEYNTVDAAKAVKYILDGQIVIVKDGKTYNALGQQID